MSEEPPISSLPGEATDDTSIAARQTALGQEWSRVYSNPDLPLDNNAELILRNPTVYLHDVDPTQLPEELQNRWHQLLGFCEKLADIADTETASWTGNTHGLERIQTLVYGGRISPDFRGSVGDVIRVSSGLFAESLQHLPGDTAHYQANIDSADSYLGKHRPPTGE